MNKKFASVPGGLMLIRKEGQTVVINNGEVTMEVVQISGKKVQLSIRASREVRIQRGEAIKGRDAQDQAGRETSEGT